MDNKKYEPLRDMEAFTEDMFNRVIAFQEKQHPAWNNTLDFSARLEGLPLHYLIFSCADRDPAKFGPTIAHYYPLREEIQKIAYYLRQVSDQPVLCDVFPGNGFIGSLIARETGTDNQPVKTIGIKHNISLPNQIGEFYDISVYQYTDNVLADTPCNAALISWPPAESNPTPEVLALDPDLIIYIYTDHKNEETGERQTGSDAMLDSIPGQYKLIDNWSVTRQKDLLHEVWPDMTPNPEEVRHVRIYAKEPHHELLLTQPLAPATAYDWEKDLQMAELALEAKRDIEMRGFMA